MTLFLLKVDEVIYVNLCVDVKFSVYMFFCLVYLLDLHVFCV